MPPGFSEWLRVILRYGFGARGGPAPPRQRRIAMRDVWARVMSSQALPIAPNPSDTEVQSLPAALATEVSASGGGSRREALYHGLCTPHFSRADLSLIRASTDNTLLHKAED
jgi:hypothetical protein